MQKSIFWVLLFLVCGMCPLLIARLSEDERQLNANIREFRPVFTEAEKNPLFDVYELEREERSLKCLPLLQLQLRGAENVSTKLRNFQGGHFLGHSNERTELTIILKDNGELFRPLVSIPITEGSYEFNFELLEGMVPLKMNRDRPVKFNVVVDVQIKHLPIRVTDSRKMWRSYAKAKVFWVDVAVSRKKR